MKYVWIVEDKEYNQLYVFSSKKKALEHINKNSENDLELYKHAVN